MESFGILVDFMLHKDRSVPKGSNFILMIFFKASKMVGCNLVRQSDMPFEFYVGACSTFKTPKEKVLMCFDAHYGKKRCDRLVKKEINDSHFFLALMVKRSKDSRQQNAIIM